MATENPVGYRKAFNPWFEEPWSKPIVHSSERIRIGSSGESRVPSGDARQWCGFHRMPEVHPEAQRIYPEVATRHEQDLLNPFMRHDAKGLGAIE
jgi:hypothetical protein